MSDDVQRDLELAVNATQGGACSHDGTFFVEEMVEGKLKTIAVETFQLRGHPEASQAFAWAWNDNKERRYMAVLRVPPIDSPHDAIRATIASIGSDLSDVAHNVRAILPGSHVMIIPCTPTMDVKCDFEFFESYTVFCPSGDISFREAVEIISQSLSFASFLRINRLMVDATNLTGFPSPSIWERFWMASEWAAITNSLRLAVVARSELIDASRFGVTVARNRGLFANVFTDERQAIEWLHDPKAA